MPTVFSRMAKTMKLRASETRILLDVAKTDPSDREGPKNEEGSLWRPLLESGSNAN
jgi:hypothetical protein